MGKITSRGKFLALILRHKPETIGIVLDEHGWANVEELIEKISQQDKYFNMEVLEDIVKTDSKQRYTFNEDKTMIRANQGHSIKVDVELKEVIPPEEPFKLYHGTSIKYIYPIMTEGIKGMNRQYVHLTDDYNTALNVGSRHGFPIAMTIDIKAMVSDGVKFYLSKNGVWLTKYVDPKYITTIS